MIALIGGAGSIGRRYQACLNHLKVPFRVLEAGESFEDLKGITKAIIATPTDTHISWCERLAKENIPFLCEKPLSTKSSEIKELMKLDPKAWVVNNWAFLMRAMHFNWGGPFNEIEYDFFNTGKDGLIWDVCQLIELAILYEAKLTVKTNSYFWNVHISRQPVHYSAIEASYPQMLEAFLDDRTDLLWNLTHALQMTETCEQIEKEIGRNPHGFYFHPSQKRIQAITRKSFRAHRRKSDS